MGNGNHGRLRDEQQREGQQAHAVRPVVASQGAAALQRISAYRVVSRDAVCQRGIRGIPPQRVEEISPTAWFDAWWQANLATDPVGAKQDPPVVRAPNGVLKDIVDYWGAGKATWEPEMIRVPTLLILAEWDQDTPLYMAQEIFAKLVNAPYKRHVVIGEGTHTVALEKNRMHLINQVQNFLDE